MADPDVVIRERSVSNHSSVNTPKLRKRLSDFKKDSLVFSQILKKDKMTVFENNSILAEKQKQDNKPAFERMRKDSQCNIVIKKTRDHNEPEERAKNITPCSDLWKMFHSGKISDQYILEMEKHKFKLLVIVGLILPTEMMKKVIKLIDFSQEYKISLPEMLFSTNFNRVKGEEVDYVFWTYEIGQNSNNAYSLRTSLNNASYAGRFSPVSNRSIKDSKHRRLSYTEQHSANMRSLIVEVPQIVITTKNFIQENTELFFPTLMAELPTSSIYEQPNITLQPELDIEKSLLYIDQEEINKSEKSIPTPKYMETSSRIMKEMKMKNPEVKNSEYFELEPDEEFFDEDDRQKKTLAEKGELDKLKTARSNEQNNTEKDDAGNNENFRLLDLLEKKSIFKHINYLPPSLLQNQSYFETYSKEQKYKQTNKNEKYRGNDYKTGRSRKNSLNVQNMERKRLEKFMHFLNQQILMSLKKNYHYSRFCCSWIFLHFITNFYQLNVQEKQITSNLHRYQDFNFGSRESSDMDGLAGNHINNGYLNSGNNTFEAGGVNNYSGLMIKSLRSFKKQIELRFFQRVENEYKGVMDQSILRNILRTIKMEELIFMKKNLSCVLLPPKSLSLQSKAYSDGELTKEYLGEIEQEVTQFMDRLEDEIYFENNKLAVANNYRLLEAEYERIIEAGFRKQRLRKKESAESNSSLTSEERSLKMTHEERSLKSTESWSGLPQQSISKQLQTDFTQFMQAYAAKSIKASSQMKTFSDFMQKKKTSYLKSISQLTRQKKSEQKEEQQKLNKEQRIKLLEMEIFKMEDKKKEVRDKNELIKRQIKSIERRSGEEGIQKQESLSRRGNLKLGRGLTESENMESGSMGLTKTKSVVDVNESGQKERKVKKATSFAFEIENSKGKGYHEESTKKDKDKDRDKDKEKEKEKNKNRKSFNRYSNRKSMQGSFYNYNRESFEEEELRKLRLKKRCLTCCEIM